MSLANISKILECPICLEVPRMKRIMQCANGHPLCACCNEKVKVCPVCKTLLQNIRCLVAEQISELIPYPCTFEKNGCLTGLKKEALPLHEKACPFHLVRCASQICEEKVSFAKLLEHTAKHSIVNGFENIRSNMSLANISKILECPICIEVPRMKRIMQCANGHPLCACCNEKVKVCPVCKMPLQNIRCLVAEQISELIPYPCTLEKIGCLTGLKKEALPLHEKACPFRIVRCPSQICEEKVSFAKLLEHTAKHSIANGFENIRLRIIESQFSPSKTGPHIWHWLPRHFEFQQRHFFSIHIRDDTKRICYFWVYLAGTPDEARQFKFLIVVKTNWVGRYFCSGPVRSAPSTLRMQMLPKVEGCACSQIVRTNLLVKTTQ